MTALFIAYAPSSKLAWTTPVVTELTGEEARQVRECFEGLDKIDIGHNGPPSDPGHDETYRIPFDVPEWVSRDQIRRFERAIQEQGAFDDRLAALDQAAFRVRASSAISHRGFRFYDAILDLSKGGYRCCISDLVKLGYIAGIDGSNASKIIYELEEADAVIALRFTEGRLTSPRSLKVLLAPIVTAEDRAKASADRILAEADEAKRADMQKRAEVERNRHRRSHPKPGTDASLTVAATVRNSESRGNGQSDFLTVDLNFSDRQNDYLRSLGRAHRQGRLVGKRLLGASGGPGRRASRIPAEARCSMSSSRNSDRRKPRLAPRFSRTANVDQSGIDHDDLLFLLDRPRPAHGDIHMPLQRHRSVTRGDAEETFTDSIMEA
jgi:hypothetical protein